MSFAPKTQTPAGLEDNTSGRAPTQSPAQVLPLGFGRFRVAVQWVTPVLHWKFRNTSRSSQAFFSCYGWLCHGPVDEILNVIVNSKAYTGFYYSRSDFPGVASVDHTIANETPEKFRAWWGLEDHANYSAYLQSLVGPDCPSMAGKTHPDYHGICGLAVQDMFAGQSLDGSTPALPQVEVELYRRSPAAYSFGGIAWGTNPVGIVKDILTLKRGGRGLPASLFDADTWTDAMQRVMDVGVAGIKGVDLWPSIVIASPKQCDEAVADVLSYIGGFLVERNGKLEIGWSAADTSLIDEEALRVITEHELAEDDVDEDPGTLEALPSQVTVTGLDYTANPVLTEASESSPIPTVLRQVGEARQPSPIAMPGWVTRRQLKAYADMRAAMMTNPESSYVVPVLRQYATQLDNLTPLRPGDLFILNLQGNGGKRVIVRITERSTDDGVKIILKCVRERGTFPVPAQPALDPRVDLTIPPPADLARYVIAQLPPDLSDADDTYIAPLVERPSNSVASFELDMNATNTWPGIVLDKINAQWAVAAVLQTTLAATLGDVTVSMNTVGADWAYLRSQAALEQSDDSLLVYRAGEWFSVGAITPTGGGSYTLALKRARLGSLPAAHAIGSVMFVIERNSLRFLTHTEFSNIELAGNYNAGVATKYFKVRPLGANGQPGNFSAATALTLRDPTPNAPTLLVANVGTGKLVDLRWAPVTGALVNEYTVNRATGPAFSDDAEIGSVVASDNPHYIDTQVVIGTEYRYRVKAHATDESESPFSGTVNATPVVIGSLVLDHTLPTPPAASARTGEGFYLSDDGTVFAYEQLTVLPLTANAAGQDLLSSRGISDGMGGYTFAEWRVESPLFNTVADGPVVVRVDDLTPGAVYRFGVRPYNFAGDEGAVVLVTGSPFIAPGKTSLPTAPGALAYTSGTSGGFGRPAYFLGGNTMCLAVRINWPVAAEKDVVAAEWVTTGVFQDTDADADAAVTAGLAQRVTIAEAVVYDPFNNVKYFRVRFIDATGNRSAWRGGGVSLASYWGLPAGTMSEQNSTDVTSTGLTTGAGASQRQVVARQPIYATLTFTGGTPQVTVDFSLSGFGFSVRPDSGWMQSADYDRMMIRYDVDDSTSTNAKLRITMGDGTNVPSVSGMEVTGEFLEYD